jgi:hypothetical protein
MKLSPSLCFVTTLPFLTQAFSPKHHADTSSSSSSSSWKNLSKIRRPETLTFWSAAFWSVLAPVAFAVSGGGLDFAGIDISGQDFSKGNYKGKDFTQGAFCLAKKQTNDIPFTIPLTLLPCSHCERNEFRWEQLAGMSFLQGLSCQYEFR